MNSNQSRTKSGSSDKTVWLTMTVSVLIVLSFWAASWWYLTSKYSKLQTWGDRGNFGQMFGAVSALFTALAVAFALITLYLQVKSIRETREDANEERFQGIFFRLLQLQQEALRGIERYKTVAEQHIKIGGHQLFANFYEELKNQFLRFYTAYPQEDQLALINKSYMAFYDAEQANVGHYFRSLYNIVKFIDSSRVRDKQMYMNLLRAQLSSNEFLILFYNCLSDKGIAKFKPLVERYALLENVPEAKLFTKVFNIGVDHRSYYKEGAFSETRQSDH